MTIRHKFITCFSIIVLILGISLPAGNSLAAEQSAYQATPVQRTEQPITGISITYPDFASANAHLDHTVRARFVRPNGDWGDWVVAEASYDGPTSINETAPEALVLTAPTQEYQLAIAAESGLTISDFQIDELLVPTKPESIFSVHRQRVASVPIPDVEATMIPRWSWGANEALRYVLDNNSDQDSDADDKDDEIDERISRVEKFEDGEELYWPYEYRRETKGIVIHHTVTANGQDIDDYGDIVNAIYQYHTLRRGWGDIGYNLLIAPNGQVFQGRSGGLDVSGAHASGYNYETLGIALIGNFEVGQPSSDQLQALFRTIIAIADKYDLDINGNYTANERTHDVISGHRDVGRTACPGRYMYDLLPAVRFITSRVVSQSQGTGAVRDLEPLRPTINLDAREKISVDFTIENTSNQTWDSLSFAFPEHAEWQYAVRFPERNGDVVAEVNRGFPIKNGETVQVTVELAAELYNGFVPILLSPVINGTQYDNSQVLLPVFVQAEFDYEVLKGSTKIVFTEDSEIDELTFRVRNLSDFTWRKGDVHLGVVQPINQQSRFAQSSSAKLWELDNDVDAGRTATITVPVENPQGQESFSETWNLIIDNFGTAQSIGFKISYEYSEPELKGLSFVSSGNSSALAAQRNRLASLDRLDDSAISAVIPSSGVDSEPIRVHLSYVEPQTTTISLNSTYALIVDQQQQFVINPQDKIVVEKSNDATQVTANGVQLSGNTIRLEPVAGSVGIFELIEYEQRPAWNPDLNDNKFRGSLEVRLDPDTKDLIFINELPMYQYLRGIAEVSNGTNPEMIKTLMVLSRTYAALHRQVYNTVAANGDTSQLQFENPKYPGKPYSANDDPNSFQKYRGYGYEQRSPNVTKYLDEVINEIVTYNGKLVITPYSSCTNGSTTSGEERWGWDFAPYLQPVTDPGGGEGKAAGHGVGVSGCGGRVLAEEEGYTYKEIIDYFYQDVIVTSE